MKSSTNFPINTRSYKDYYYCTRGCGNEFGWIKHGGERIGVTGRILCPYCGSSMRTKSRFAFGVHREKEPLSAIKR